MIGRPKQVDTAFTVPPLDEFIQRIMPGMDWEDVWTLVLPRTESLIAIRPTIERSDRPITGCPDDIKFLLY